MAALPQPEIHADGGALRPWWPADRPVVVAAYADPAIRHWHFRSMSDDEARDWIDAWPGRWRAETGAGWAVTDAGEVVGQISLRRVVLADGLAEVSYWVLPSARGRRVAPRALSAVTSWSFETLRLHRVELYHSTANAASCAGSRTTPASSRRERNAVRPFTPTAGTTCISTPASTATPDPARAPALSRSRAGSAPRARGPGRRTSTAFPPPGSREDAAPGSRPPRRTTTGPGAVTATPFPRPPAAAGGTVTEKACRIRPARPLPPGPYGRRPGGDLRSPRQTRPPSVMDTIEAVWNFL